MENGSNLPWLCGHAWGGLVVQVDGRVKPCCRFNDSYDIGEDHPATAPALAKIREQMLAGRPPAGCAKCVLEESAGSLSKRQRSDRLFPESLPRQSLTTSVLPEYIRYLEINLSNICNLRCLMCSPQRSSAWNQEAERAGYELFSASNLPLERLDALLEYAETIEILGGETFLAPNLLALLEKIKSVCRSKKLVVVLSTNLTRFASEELRESLKGLRRVQIFCSIDAVGGRNEYIRYPSKWREVQENLARFIEWQKESRNIKLSVTATVSAFSYAGLPDLLEWWMGLVKENEPFLAPNRLWLNPVTVPEFQSVQVLPRRVREEVAEKLLREPSFRLDNVMSMIRFSLQMDKTELHPQLLEWVARMDSGRLLKARDCVPEIFVSP